MAIVPVERLLVEQLPQAQMLMRLDAANKALAEANAIPDVKDIRDKVVAIEGYMRQQKAGTAAISKATTIRLRAERKLGLLLKEMPKNQGSRGRIQEHLSSGGCNAQPPDGPPTWKELGIEKTAAMRYQQVAALPEETVENLIQEAAAKDDAISVSTVLKLARQQERAANPVSIQDATDDFTEQGFHVNPGEWWQLGEHLLFCGDSASPAFVEFAKRQSAKLAFADPPYNAGVAEWDVNFEWRHDWLAGAADVVAVTPGIGAIPDFLVRTDMPYRWSASCHITNGMTRGAMGFGNWIYIALFSNQSVFAESQDIFSVAIRARDGDGAHHKGRKPLELLRKLMALYTNEGDTVIDPFLGSGTTLIAAAQLGRRCIGAELDPVFAGRIIARWEDASGQTAALAN